MTVLTIPAECRPLDLVGLGECLVEFHAEEPLGQARALTRGFGGDVLNALVSAARLGSRAGFISRVGDDPFGADLVAAWRDEQIDTRCTPLVPGENGVYFISLRAGGEREFTYRRAGSAASHLSEDDVDEAYIASSRMVLLSGITQAISPSAQAATLKAASVARHHSTVVAFDPNARPKLWAARGGQAAARAAFGELLPLVDVLLPSFPADLWLTEPSVDTPEAALNVFASLAPLVALKAGEDGARLSGPPRQHVPAVPVAVVRDTTGAGDAWNGAFLHALAAGRDLHAAAELANRTAAAKLTHRGALPPHPLSRSPFPQETAR